jgi:hypothetical protein
MTTFCIHWLLGIRFDCGPAGYNHGIGYCSIVTAPNRNTTASKLERLSAGVCVDHRKRPIL